MTDYIEREEAQKEIVEWAQRLANPKYLDNCINCDSCNGYITNPSMYITQNIGSRNDQTIFYYGKTDKGMSIQIQCGCFHGDLKEFAEAVEKTHGADEYGEQYRREIEKVKALFELEREEK